MSKYLPRKYLLMKKRKSVKVTTDEGKLRNYPRSKRLRRHDNRMCCVILSCCLLVQGKEDISGQLAKPEYGL